MLVTKTWSHGVLQLERKLTVAIVGEYHACVTEFCRGAARVCFIASACFSGVAVYFVASLQ